MILYWLSNSGTCQPHLVTGSADLAAAEDHILLQAGGVAPEGHVGLLLQVLHALQVSRGESLSSWLSARDRSCLLQKGLVLCFWEGTAREEPQCISSFLSLYIPSDINVFMGCESW